jgi:hypothetical protein
VHYDVASKVLMEKCRGEILRRFLGMAVLESTILEELPQETVSLMRSDFPILVTDEHGDRRLVLIEIQSSWDRHLPLRLLDYRTRHLLKHGVEVVSCILLLRPSPALTERYVDNEVNYRYRVVRVYDLDAREFLAQEVPCLLPFVPLMKHGPELTARADELLYQSPLPRSDKSDMLTVMAIFSGMVSSDLSRLLVSRRRDLMIESAAYDVIRQEGVQEGMQQGMLQGMLQDARESILDNLEVRFGLVPTAVADSVNTLDQLPVLKALRRKSAVVLTLDEFKNALAQVE